jgi:hypothetical protein
MKTSATPRFAIHSTTWTPEDVEFGEPSDRDTYFEGSEDLASALYIARELGIDALSDSELGEHTWFVSTDDDVNMRTGARTCYSLHALGVTMATKRRIARALGITGV